MKISFASLLSHLIPIDSQFELVKSNVMGLWLCIHKKHTETLLYVNSGFTSMQVHAAFVVSLANAHCLFNRNEVDVNWHSLIPLQSLTSALPTNFLSGELFISHS